MSHGFRFWVTAAHGGLFTLIVVLLLGTVYTVGPEIETRLFPVVVDFEICPAPPTPCQQEFPGIEAQGPPAAPAISQFDLGVSLDKLHFRKARGCEYIGSAWYLGKRDGEFVRVPMEVRRTAGDKSSPNRPLGRQISGPWILGIATADEVLNNSFAEFQHRCHFAWITTTRFYP